MAQPSPPGDMETGPSPGDGYVLAQPSLLGGLDEVASVVVDQLLEDVRIGVHRLLRSVEWVSEVHSPDAGCSPVGCWSEWLSGPQWGGQPTRLQLGCNARRERPVMECRHAPKRSRRRGPTLPSMAAGGVPVDSHVVSHTEVTVEIEPHG